MHIGVCCCRIFRAENRNPNRCAKLRLMQDNAKDKNHSPIDATLLMRQVRSSLIAQRLEPAPLVRAVLDPDAAFRACNVRYILLNRLPVTLLLVSSTGQRAAKKSQKLFFRASFAAECENCSSRKPPMATNSEPKMLARSLLDFTFSLVVERIFSKFARTGFSRNQIMASLSLSR